MELLERKRGLRGAPASRTSAIGPDLNRLKEALATELKEIERQGLSAPGLGVDAHRHRLLVRRLPTGELKVVRRLKPFRWSSKVRVSS